MKVVINDCHGGFSLSPKAFEWLMKEKGWRKTTYDDASEITDIIESKSIYCHNYYFNITNDDPIFRSHPDIISCIETLGEDANGECADLKIIDIPFDTTEGWHVAEYDGLEWIAEDHRIWG